MGKVKTLFFLPGMMCDERLFSSQLSYFSQSFRCVSLSFAEGDSIGDYAKNVITLLEKNDPDTSSNILIGLSMGGIVAMECMRQAPELIAAVILMDTNPLAEEANRQRLRVPQIQRALEGEMHAVLIEEMKPLYLAPDNRSDEALLALVLDMAESLGSDVFINQSKALMNRRDNVETLSRWAKPSMILFGAHDVLCPPSRHRMMHSLMQESHLVEVSEAGHLPTLEAPAQVIEALDVFIQTV